MFGTYAHGLFADDRQRGAWLARFGAVAGGFDHEAEIEAALDALAAHLEEHVECDALMRIAGE